MNENEISSLLRGLANSSGAAKPASSVLKNLNVAELASKLVKPATPTQNFGAGGLGDMPMITTGVDQITRNIITKTSDADNIFKLFPDISLAAQIIISSVISPKDMIRASLNFRVENSFLPTAFTNEALTIMRHEITVEYAQEKDLSKILKQALFGSGSYVRMILPEAAVDHLINGRQELVAESIFESGLIKGSKSNPGEAQVVSLGFLGNSASAQAATRVRSFESMAMTHVNSYVPKLSVPEFRSSTASSGDKLEKLEDFVDLKKFRENMVNLVEVVDNHHYLKMPLLQERIRSTHRNRIMAQESHSRAAKFEQMADAILVEEAIKNPTLVGEAADSRMTRKEIESLVYKAPNREARPFVSVPGSGALKRRSIGRGLQMDLPSSAVIPIYHTTNPEEHIGYLVPTDFDGNPVSEESRGYEGGGFASFLDSNRNNNGLSGYLTEKARKNLTDDERVPLIETMAEIVAEITESDIAERFASGAVGRNYKIAKNQDVYRIMLSRILKGQFTRLLYIPAEYITYFAFEYHKNGVGKSYLDDLKHITSLRATTLFATVSNLIKSAITVTNVETEISENDPDPIRTAEKVRHFVARMRQSYFPHGLNRIVDLSDWIQKAGIEMSFKGNSKLPKTTINTEVRGAQRPLPSQDLDERFRHQSYMHFGLAPETVDAAAKTDFATTVEQHGVLFTQRITLLADRFCELLTDFNRKLARHDQVIMDKLRKAVESNKEVILKRLPDNLRIAAEQDPIGFQDYVIEKFLSVFVTDLPRPESRQLDNLGKAFKEKEEEVENAIKYVIDQEALPEELIGQSSNALNMLKGAIKSQIMRDWMSENGYAKEVLMYAQTDEENKPLVDLSSNAKAFAEKVAMAVMTWLKDHKPLINAADADLSKMANPESQEEESDAEGGEGPAAGTEDTGSSDPGVDDGANPFDNPLISGDE